ncbi:hypothetical protein Gotri_003058 [Gossypium trilobum]|uniref:Uncharacterized protein n=1 Tax=Gossypium trilobum TaxID=34281 RepID=A0A7J9FA48_9ROSI|nr:hypothetical protein [Gossypium trilobum]
MEIEKLLFVKRLTKIDTENRLSVPNKGCNRIGMIRGECLPLVQNHDAEEPSALAVASYTDVEEEATVASNSSTG